MDQDVPSLHRARFKQDPTVAIDIAYRFSERYFQAGRPELDQLHPENDDWYTEGALSGGRVSYAVTGLDEDSPTKYEYTEEPADWQDNWEAVCSIEWGRGGFGLPEFIEITLRYPEPWWPDEFTRQHWVGRRFVPSHIGAPERPHLPANREQIYDWVNQFIDRPKEANAAAGVRFVGGEGAVDHVKSEMANLFLSPDEPDVVSTEYLSSRYEISYGFALELASEMVDGGKITEIHPPDQHFEPAHLYGDSTEWDRDDQIPDDDGVTLKIKG